MPLLPPILLLGLLLHGAARAACPADASLLDALEERASSAFTSANRAELDAALRDGEALMACLPEPLTEAQAGQMHRLFALGAFVDGQDTETVAFLRAGCAGECAAAELPFATGHPLARYQEIAATTPRSGERAVPGTPREAYWVDGLSRGPIPAEVPAILQRDDGGDWLEGALLRPGEPLPAWLQEEHPTRAARRLGIGAITLGALAGACLVPAALAQADLEDPSTPYVDLASLRRRANVWSGVSVGLGTLALTGGAAMALTW